VSQAVVKMRWAATWEAYLYQGTGVTGPLVTF